MDYKSAGVDIDKADNLIEDVSRLAKKTYIDGVLSGVGGFGSLFELKNYKNPVVVASTDGIGTKILLAKKLNNFKYLGYDLVAMCVDDIICCGAKPLFFLDYIAVGKLIENQYLEIIKSISDACIEAECALVGGETAELPGMYPVGDFDLAGFSVGIVEKEDILNPINIKENDTVIGLYSSGFHSNGYSLVRKIVEDNKINLDQTLNNKKIGDLLLAPTKIYCKVIFKALQEFKKSIKGISHITGGGIEGNLPRVLPDNVNAIIYKGEWVIPEIIKFIVEKGNVSENEAYKVFNMGIGMILVCDKSIEKDIITFFNNYNFESKSIGYITKGNNQVIYK